MSPFRGGSAQEPVLRDERPAERHAGRPGGVLAGPDDQGDRIPRDHVPRPHLRGTKGFGSLKTCEAVFSAFPPRVGC
ncbi:hypothetical protein [Streptomyces sp. NPDC019224]|uniref:hypothetical protein n=1 Tax=Streptomyces sp. NPDC019224 TaxID=3154484 RepID=UPI0033E7AC87